MSNNIISIGTNYSIRINNLKSIRSEVKDMIGQIDEHRDEVYLADRVYTKIFLTLAYKEMGRMIKRIRDGKEINLLPIKLIMFMMSGNKTPFILPGINDDENREGA